MPAITRPGCGESTQAKVLRTTSPTASPCETGKHLTETRRARDNNSFGLTTMRDDHVKVDGREMHFRFRGKSGVKHDVDLTDRRLAVIVKRCRDLPGQELFQYLDENGEQQTIGSAEVNEYLR